MMQKNQRKERQLVHDLTDEKLHYKMYKVGKNFVFASLLTLGFSAVLATFSPNTVRADTQQDAETESTGTVSAADQSSTTAVLRSSSNESSGSDVAANTPTTADTATSNSTKTSTADTATTDSTKTNTDKTATKATNSGASDASSGNVTSAKTAVTPASNGTNSTDSSALSGTSTLSDAKTLPDNSNATADTTSKTTTTDSSDNVKTGQTSSDSDTTTLDLTQNSVKLGQGASKTATSDAAKTAPVDLTAAQTAVLTSLPTGSTYKVGTDGTLTIALNSATDETTITSIQSRLVTAGFKSVNLTVSAAGETWRTYSTSTVSDEQARSVQTVFSTPVTMGDIALMGAAGTGSYTDLTTKQVVTNASVSQLQNYYNELETEYSSGSTDALRFSNFLKPVKNDATTFGTYMNYLSEIYYYFDGASDSYVSQLNKAIDGMSPQQKAAMAQTGMDDSGTGVLQSLEQDVHAFSLKNILHSTDYKNPQATADDLKGSLGTFKLPAGMSQDFYDSVFSQFIDSIFATYIDAIVPSAEKYVLNQIMPAVNTISDLSGVTSTTDTGVQGEVDANLYPLVHSLMTIDGSYSLTTILPHLEAMYQNAKKALSGLGIMEGIAGVNDTETLAEYVGAAAPGSVSDWNAQTETGNMKAFSNFSAFNDIYYAYSKALVSTLYGSAMLGKYKALSIMYSENAADPDAAWTALGITATTAPKDIKVANLDSTIDTTKETQVETFQQGAWDVYHYIKPFYDAALKDLATGKVTGDTPQATEDAVWDRVTNPAKGGQTLTDSAGQALTLTPDASVDTSETNPHEQANYVSPQSKAYFTSFYNAAVKANALAYSEQPIYRTTLTNSDGDVISTTDTNLSKPITTNVSGAALTGVYGGSIDTSNLPASLTFDGKPISKPADLSTYAVPENGGVIKIIYGSQKIKEGQTQAVSVTATNVPAGQTFDYTITNSDGATVSQGSKVAYGTASANGLTLDLGQTLTISNYATGTEQPTVTPATSLTYDNALLDSANNGKAGIVVAYTNNQSKDSSALASDAGIFNGVSDKLTNDQSDFVSDLVKSNYDSAGLSSDIANVLSDVNNMNSDLGTVSSDLSNEKSDVGSNGTSDEVAKLTSDTTIFNTDSANASNGHSTYVNDGVLKSDDAQLNSDLSNFTPNQSDFTSDQTKFMSDIAVSDTTSGTVSNDLSNLNSDLGGVGTNESTVVSDVGKEENGLGSALTVTNAAQFTSDYNAVYVPNNNDKNAYASDQAMVKSNALSNDQRAINSDQTKVNSDSNKFQSDQSNVASDLSDSNTTSGTLTSDENKTSNDLSNFSDDNSKLTSDNTKEKSDLGSNVTSDQQTAVNSDSTQLSNDNSNYQSDSGEYSDDVTSAANVVGTTSNSNALSNGQSNNTSDQGQATSDENGSSNSQSSTTSDQGQATSDENGSSNGQSSTTSRQGQATSAENSNSSNAQNNVTTEAGKGKATSGTVSSGTNNISRSSSKNTGSNVTETGSVNLSEGAMNSSVNTQAVGNGEMSTNNENASVSLQNSAVQNGNKASNEQKELPQTNETNQSGVLGLLGVELMSLLGLFGIKRKRHDEK